MGRIGKALRHANASPARSSNAWSGSRIKESRRRRAKIAFPPARPML